MVTTVLTAISLPPSWRRIRRHDRSCSVWALGLLCPLTFSSISPLVTLRRFQESLPQVPVRHRLILSDPFSRHSCTCFLRMQLTR